MTPGTAKVTIQARCADCAAVVKKVTTYEYVMSAAWLIGNGWRLIADKWRCPKCCPKAKRRAGVSRKNT